jgi:hypothetical protein
MRTRRHPKWVLPAFCVALGLGCLAAFWAGGNRNQGLFSLAVLAGLGLAFALGGRSETIRGLRGDGRDEYWESLDLTATALAGLVLIGAVIAMCFWEWGHGRDGSPYSQLAAITGVAYIVILVVLRLRR